MQHPPRGKSAAFSIWSPPAPGCRRSRRRLTRRAYGRLAPGRADTTRGCLRASEQLCSTASTRADVVWGRTKKRDAWGRRKESNRPKDEWVVTTVEHLRIVSDELWTSAHEALQRGARPGTARSGAARRGCRGAIDTLKAELARLEGELTRYADAIADAGPLATILQAAKVREQRRDAIRAELPAEEGNWAHSRREKGETDG